MPIIEIDARRRRELLAARLEHLARHVKLDYVPADTMGAIESAMDMIEYVVNDFLSAQAKARAPQANGRARPTD